MTDLQLLYDEWGAWLVLGVAFAEFIGVPVAALPVLVLAGSLAPTVGAPFWVIPAVAVLGAFPADVVWFTLARHRGRVVVDRACGLTSNPAACVTVVRRRVAEAGPGFFVVAKLLPGVSNLVAAAAGLAHLPPTRFLGLNLVALSLWACLWSGVGWGMSGQLVRFMPLLDQNLHYALAGAVVLMVAAGVWRVHKVRLHKGLHVRDGRAR